ncbi:MAG: type II toxin-antitoxin system VapB family antitoxin [Okeania sp. SIO2H7]|nr:type II toxin-antitoxin system VapB family antitoxin [Okeania sp. SIO2H7]
MTTQIELNEELVKEALSLTDFQTEKELIEFALQELIRTRRKKLNLPAEAIGAIHTSNLAAKQLVQLLEKKEAKNA